MHLLPAADLERWAKFENPNKMPTMLSDLAKDFLKEEQKQRRCQIENLIARIETDQQYGLGATGLFWGFLRKTDPGSRMHSLVIKRLDE